MQLHWRKPRPNEIDHELLWFSVTAGTFLCGGAWLAARLPLPHCVFHSVTGLPCVTCGATRAAVQFFHGHLGVALLFNPLACALYLGFLLFDLYALAVLLARAPRLRVGNFTPLEKRVVRFAVLLLLAGNWLYLLNAGRV